MNKGSEWRIWDLHLHIPASYDYKDKTTTNEEIVNELVNNGVSVVAIIDNSKTGISLKKDVDKSKFLIYIMYYPKFCVNGKYGIQFRVPYFFIL